MLKYLYFAILAAFVFLSAPASAAEFSCSLAPSEQQKAIAAGLPANGDEVMHLSTNANARSVTVWETSSEFPDAHKSTYSAQFAGSMVAWAVGDPEDGPQAHEYVDTSSNTLITVDPDGDATRWDCTRS